jgi:hypothetical protein
LVELDELEHLQQQQLVPTHHASKSGTGGIPNSNSNPKFPRSNPFNKNEEDQNKKSARAAAIPASAVWPQIHSNYGKKIESDRIAWCQKHSVKDANFFLG